MNIESMCTEIRRRFDEAGYYIARKKGDKIGMKRIFNGIWIELIEEFQGPIPKATTISEKEGKAT